MLTTQRGVERSRYKPRLLPASLRRSYRMVPHTALCDVTVKVPQTAFCEVTVNVPQTALFDVTVTLGGVGWVKLPHTALA